MLTPAQPTGGPTASASEAAKPKSAGTGGPTGFASHLRAAAKATPSASANRYVQRPHGEKLEPVSGHHFERIAAGADKGLYVNELSGSPRKGEAFRLVERDGKAFHVYGEGRNQLVVEIGSHHTVTGGKSPAGSTGGTSSAR